MESLDERDLQRDQIKDVILFALDASVGFYCVASAATTQLTSKCQKQGQLELCVTVFFVFEYFEFQLMRLMRLKKTIFCVRLGCH